MHMNANEMLMRLDSFLDENLSLIIFENYAAIFKCALKK